jgi:hypothetical protein
MAPAEASKEDERNLLTGVPKRYNAYGLRMDQGPTMPTALAESF